MDYRIRKSVIGLLFALIVLSVLAQSRSTVKATVTVTSPVNPNLVLQDDFQGFGTSLAWWADVVGGWSEPQRSQLMNYLFADTFTIGGQTVQGIDLSSVRYNAGASEPGVSYQVVDPHWPPRNGAWVDSLVQANGTYNWTVDANQRWVLEQAALRGVTTFELFGNSPPWFMTYSGHPAGRYSYNSSQGCSHSNLPGEYEDDYAIYLATVAERFEEVGVNGPGSTKVHFETIEPFNEPSNGWWCWGNNQEGTYLPSWQQSTIINELRAELDARGLPNVGIAATDSNNYWLVVSEYDALSAQARANLDQINAHGYAGSDPEPVRNRVLAENMRFWQSEWGPADWGGYSITSDLDSALELATRVANDLTYVRANMWQYWQAVEDSSRGSGPGYWGLIQAPLDGSSQTFAIKKQFYVLGQYSKFIKPGYLIIDGGNGKTVAAYDPATSKLVLVTYNDSAETLPINYDLSRFTTTGATAQVWRTSGTENLVQLSSVNVSGGVLNGSVPAYSVVTYVVSNVVYNAPTTTAEVVNDNALSYSGSWSDVGYSGGGVGAYGLWDQDEHSSQSTNATATHVFYGTKVHLYATIAPTSGRIAVSIDNGAETLVNLYNTVRLDGMYVWSSANLTAGRHTLKVRITGQTGAPGGGVWGNVDRVVVENSGWTFCANEGQTCSFSGTAEVRYGANGDDTRGVYTGGVACNSTVFGNPASGSKKCYYRSIATTALVSANSEKCAGVASGSTTPGADVIQWSCLGVNDQKWTVVPVTGGYQLKPVHAPTQCLDVAGASSSDGANVLQWTCGTGQNQVWDFVYVRDGYYVLMPNHTSNKCLDVAGAGMGDGADIVQYTCNRFPNQLWHFGAP